MNSPEPQPDIIQGISGSPGICIGKAYLVDREGVNITKRYPVSPGLVPKEVDRFKQAVTKAINEHAKVIETLDQNIGNLGDNVSILETHMVLFKDKMLYGQTIDTINAEFINAEWALKKVTRKIRSMFEQIDDQYLQARINDIVQVSDKIMSCLVGANDIKISAINKRVILVAHDLTPADASQIQLERIKGFVTDRGGKDSHTSIVAKSLKIPSVQGLGVATSMVKNDDLIIVDGSAGTLIINPDEDMLFEYEERINRFEAYHADLERESHLPAVTADGIRFNLMANIELLEEVVAVKNSGPTDIGLFRSEFFYLDLERFPTEEELLQYYKELVELMHPQAVTIRTLDINGDKVNKRLNAAEEANPSLGQRAVRFCIENEAVFITQLKAIFRAAAFGNIKLLIPMISCVEEILQVKKIIEKAVLELEVEDKIFNRDIDLGIMIEVPSAALIAEQLAEHVDFFSIGTNDLIQYTMAIDRRNRKVAHLYQALNPAVLRLIKMTCDAAASKGIGVAMCGEMAGDPMNIPFLAALGLTDLSMNPVSIPLVKKVIRSLDSGRAKAAAEKMLTMTQAEEISAFIRQEFEAVEPFNGSVKPS